MNVDSLCLKIFLLQLMSLGLLEFLAVLRILIAVSLTDLSLDYYVA